MKCPCCKKRIRIRITERQYGKRLKITCVLKNKGCGEVFTVTIPVPAKPCPGTQQQKTSKGPFEGFEGLFGGNSDLFSDINDIFKKYTENSPRWLRNELRGYLEGLKDVMLDDAIIFAYEHDGKLYGTKKDGIFPHYDQSGVPLKDIHKLKSGLFYKSNGKPYFTK